MRNLHLPGRSVVHGVNGAVATSHPLSSLAAIDVLRRGSTAADAAVAACAVQGVVEPMSTGIGGDCFAIYHPAGGRPEGINGSGRAPAGLGAEVLPAGDRDAIALNSVHAVTVPGAVDAWATLLSRHGRFGLDTLLRPAIDLAENGFAVTQRVALDWRRNLPKLAASAGTASLFLRQGQPPAAGDVQWFPALAATMRAVATRDRDGFYTGPVAEAMVRTLRGMGGVQTMDDFAAQDSPWVDPVGGRYRDIDVLELPPNGQGIVVLMMLNILAGFDLGSLDPVGAERLHLEAEATRLAFAARDEHVADPAFAPVPVERLLSPEFAAELRARIDPKRAMILPPPTGPQYRDTVYISVVDRDRNVCSFINSLFFPFGSGLACPRTGVLFQNRGASFRVRPGHPNSLAPRKRPLHTIIPGLALRHGRPWMSFGVMGGQYQPVGHVHVLGNMLDHGMDVQEAIDCPRAFHTGRRLECEHGVPDAVVADLTKMGHMITRPEMPWGGGQAIVIDWARGTLAAGSDPRKDGCALAY